MIYKKDANFPYPMLTNDSTSYKDSSFIFDAELEEDTYEYKFTLKYEISSLFINNLLNNGKAKLILVIQSKDNKSFELGMNQRLVTVAKEYLSINERTSLQLYIVANEEIYFKDNDELSDFYKLFKNDIALSKYSSLGFSNIVVLEGRMKKPLDLFEKKLDENLSSEIKIELGPETIIIYYREAEYQFNDLSNKSFINPYIYIGLNNALTRFINDYGNSAEESVNISDIPTPDNLLDFKLYQLMVSKGIDELNYNNIDEVISKISDRIIGKYVYAVKELADNGS